MKHYEQGLYTSVLYVTLMGTRIDTQVEHEGIAVQGEEPARPSCVREHNQREEWPNRRWKDGCMEVSI